MKYLILDMRPGKQEFKKAKHLDPVMKTLSSQGVIQIIDTETLHLHVSGDSWTAIKEVNEK